MMRFSPLLLLLLALPAWGAQVCSTHSDGTFTYSVCEGGDVTTLTAEVTDLSPADGDGLVYVLGTGTTVSSNDGGLTATNSTTPSGRPKVYIYEEEAGVSEADVTFTLAAASDSRVYVFKFDGDYAAGTIVDQIAFADGGGLDDAPSITPTSAPSTVFALAVDEYLCDPSPTAPSGMTQLSVDSCDVSEDKEYLGAFEAYTTTSATGTLSWHDIVGDTTHITFNVLPASADPTVAFDATTYNLGDTVTVTLANFGSGTPTTVTEQAGGDTFTASGDTSQVTFTLCELSDLSPAGDCNNVKLETELTLQVSNGTESATDTLTISAPDGDFYGDLACNGRDNWWDTFTAGDCPGNSLALSTADQNDDYLCDGGAFGTVNDYLVPRFSSTLSVSNVNCRIYDESAGAWQQAYTTPFLAPTADQLAEDSETIPIELCSDGLYREVCP